MLCFVCTFSVCGFSQTVINERVVTVEITNVTINGGQVILAIFTNPEEFRKEEPGIIFVLPDNSTVISRELTLPHGEYVVTAFQDSNNNNTMDFGLFGIPKEPFGISNYEGKGFPSRNFDRQKITVNGTTRKINIGLYRL